jgi:hypothetical protein
MNSKMVKSETMILTEKEKFDVTGANMTVNWMLISKIFKILASTLSQKVIDANVTDAKIFITYFKYIYYILKYFI